VVPLFLLDLTRPEEAIEPKSIIATALVALAVVQVVTMSMVYRVLPTPAPLKPAITRLHRWEGRILLAGAVFVAVICIINWGPQTDTTRRLVHTVFGIGILVLLAAKLAIVRMPNGARYIPMVGLGLFCALVVAWSTSAYSYFFEDAKGYTGTEAASATVRITDASAPGVFEPASVSIKRGQVVEWIHESNRSHTVSGNGFVSGLSGMQRGAVFKFKFDQAGSFAYECSFHPSMTGTVVVTD
jgi:plastocyanin